MKLIILLSVFLILMNAAITARADMPLAESYLDSYQAMMRRRMSGITDNGIEYRAPKRVCDEHHNCTVLMPSDTSDKMTAYILVPVMV